MTHHTDRMPTVEEVLGGETQAGVPRPSWSLDDSLAGTDRPVSSHWARLKRRFHGIFGKGF